MQIGKMTVPIANERRGDRELERRTGVLRRLAKLAVPNLGQGAIRTFVSGWTVEEWHAPMIVDGDTRRAHRYALAAAATAAMYAGFRLNECLGTDLVFAREPADVALTFLHVLNPKRGIAVPLMVVSTLITAAISVRLARPRRLAAIGLALLLVEDAMTTCIHIPLVLFLNAAPAVPADWAWLRDRYVFDDVMRTAILISATLVLLAAAFRHGAQSSLESHPA